MVSFVTQPDARGTAAAPVSTADEKVLAGETVRLRPVRLADLAQLRAWYNRADIFPFMGRQTPLSEREQEQWFESLAADRSTRVYAVEHNESGDLLGSVTLRNLLDPAHRGELGILMGRAGSGYGSDALSTLLKYAFTVLGLNCVSLEVRGDNRRAITAYMRAGFRPEGVLRRRLFKNGVLYDLYSMSILREEFLEDLAGQ